jgi:FlaA1/EpsC-like NDP-sugar epimerase
MGKIKPLRDFFLTIFFVYLGSKINFAYLSSGIWAIITLSVFAVLFKPMVYALILNIFGFKKHTLYQTSLSLSQISEFSLIVLVIGANYGVVSPKVISVMATVGVITIIVSSMLIYKNRKIYKYFIPLLSFIERKKKTGVSENAARELGEHVVVIGAHRIGLPIVEYLAKEGIPFVVMDFNPHVVRELEGKGVNVVYGDIGDPDVLEALDLENTKLVISTATALEDNEMLLAEIRERHLDIKTVVRAEDKDHGEILKSLGADYIILPEKVSGKYLVNQIKNNWPRIVFTGLE